MTEQLSVEIEIVEARDLLASDSNGFSDPYVVIEECEGVPTTAKTNVIKKTLNPVWNYNTVICVQPSFKKLKFKVYDWDRFSSDDVIGSCSIPASMFADGVPLDIWQPLKQKPAKKSKGAAQKGPYPTKGELHLKMSLKYPASLMRSPPGYVPPTCECGDWYVLQAAAPGSVAMMAQTTMEDAASAAPFKEKVCLGLGWDTSGASGIDLDASVIAFDAKNKNVATVYFGNKVEYFGAIEHCGDNRTGDGEGDDEVIKFNLASLPEEVVRLACIVNSFRKQSLATVNNAYVRLFMGQHTLGIQRLTSLCDSIGVFFCFLQRNPNGAWFFRTVMQPISGRSANESLDDVVKILSEIPLF